MKTKMSLKGSILTAIFYGFSDADRGRVSHIEHELKRTAGMDGDGARKMFGQNVIILSSTSADEKKLKIANKVLKGFGVGR